MLWKSAAVPGRSVADVSRATMGWSVVVESVPMGLRSTEPGSGADVIWRKRSRRFRDFAPLPWLPLVALLLLVRSLAISACRSGGIWELRTILRLQIVTAGNLITFSENNRSCKACKLIRTILRPVPQLGKIFLRDPIWPSERRSRERDLGDQEIFWNFLSWSHWKSRWKCTKL